MSQQPTVREVRIAPGPGDVRFDGIGVVDGGGATSVLLKDYPLEQRNQILDLLYRPKFGASLSSLLVEVPGDGNATQGSMPSHRHTRDDIESHRGYTTWVMSEAVQRNPQLTLDATAWSAPGWLGDGEFWSHDTVDYYVTWLTLLRNEHGLELDALGCRNEKGVSLEFAKWLRRGLDEAGFEHVLLHGFDNWPADKWDFVQELMADGEAADAIDVIGVHCLYERPDQQAPPAIREWARKSGKPIWNTEDHVYKQGFDCLISVVECLNESYLLSGATKTILWYGIAGVYPAEPYSEDQAMLLAREPWSGHYFVREALWGYAHYGQFTEAGWEYIAEASTTLDSGGTLVALRSIEGDFSIIIETQDAAVAQTIELSIGPELSVADLCVWRSDERDQFVRVDDISPVDGQVSLVAAPNSVYSLSTTRGQQRGGFESVPDSARFPFPYRDTFSDYENPRGDGYLPAYTADIAGAFELVDSEDRGQCVKQVAPVRTISWAPDWRPYSIIGDVEWVDYVVSVDVRVPRGEYAGVMGRVTGVGSGYGFEPRGYYFEIDAEKNFRLIEVNGKKDKTTPVGDAEQQALISTQVDREPGGERVLAEGATRSIRADEWNTLTLRLAGDELSADINGETVATAHDSRQPRGMVGLITRAEASSLGTASFSDLRVYEIGSTPPAASMQPPRRDLYVS